MKAISLKQPWANLIADGEKTIETRTWSTNYRGPLLIVSSKRPPIQPAGCVVALVDLVGCRPMTHYDVEAARCDLYDGAVAWILARIRKVQPIPVRGSLGIYDLPYSASDLKVVDEHVILPGLAFQSEIRFT